MSERADAVLGKDLPAPGRVLGQPAAQFTPHVMEHCQFLRGTRQAEGLVGVVTGRRRFGVRTEIIPLTTPDEAQPRPAATAKGHAIAVQPDGPVTPAQAVAAAPLMLWSAELHQTVKNEQISLRSLNIRGPPKHVLLRLAGEIAGTQPVHRMRSVRGGRRIATDVVTGAFSVSRQRRVASRLGPIRMAREEIPRVPGAG